MHVLTINAGSSSLKFTLFQKNDTLEIAAEGLIERIGAPETRIRYTDRKGRSLREAVSVKGPREAVALAVDLMTADGGVLASKEQIAAVGHRVVHGGEAINHPVIIDAAIKQTIRDCFQLAPLHNPPNLAGIEACERSLPQIPQVAVFDTAFHATLPPHAFLYALPYALYQEDHVRRYGFHGTSHAYVSQRAAALLGRPLETLKLVTCHIGNGSSITAVDGGRSVDTSMGLTPLEGLVMGTRCGDIDPAIVFYLTANKRLGLDQVNDLLNRHSGLLGLAGIGSSDLRDILAAEAAGDARAKTALEVYTYRIRKYIGAYTFAMGGLDAVVFTAGIGENSPVIRARVCRGLEALGIGIDARRNAAPTAGDREIQSEASGVKVLVVPTDEERAIALQTLALLKAAGH